MADADAGILDLIASVVDGTPPRWDRLRDGATTALDQQLADDLRIVAGVAAVHRSQPLETAPSLATAVLAQTAAPPLGTWGHFELLERVGAGSFGEVFRAFDTKLQRPVAVKLLKLGLPIGEEELNRALDEGRAIARVRHDHVVTVHSVEVFDGRPGLCMEYVEGQTLEQYVAALRSLGAREAQGLGVDLCRALAAVHGAGLLHCDIKPRNVMRAANGRLVLMDFGARRLVASHGTASSIGTPLFAAPEVLRGEAPTVASDIYSVGVLLFFAVTGDYPINAASIDDLIRLHASGHRAHVADRRPDLPDALTQAIDRAVDPDPARRFRTAGELASVLAGLFDSRSSADAAEPAPPARGLWVRVSPRIAVPTVMLFLLVTGLVAAAFGRGSAPPGPVVRVAVLPFENRAGRPAWEVDASADDLLTALARLPGASVSPWSSVAPYATRRETPVADVARELGVDWVVQGIVEAGVGPDLSVSLALFDTAGRQAWSERYQKAPAALVTLPAEVMRSLPAPLGLQAGGDGTRHTPSPDARAEWAQARYLMRLTGPANFEAALERLEQAIRLDPAYAVAHVTLALCVMELEDLGAMSRDDAYRRASDALDRAQRLDYELPELHRALGTLLFEYEWDWPKAGRELRLALQLNPSDPDARVVYAGYLAARGSVDAAVEQARLAQDLDPGSPHRGDLGIMLYLAHRFGPAIRILEEDLDDQPDQSLRRYTLARSYSAAGRYDDAVAELQKVIRLVGGIGKVPVIDAELARVYATRKAPEMVSLLARLESELNEVREPNQFAHVGYVYVALGDRDRAFAYLERAAFARAKSLIWAKVDPRLDSVRDDPRYRALIRQLRLPE